MHRQNLLDAALCHKDTANLKAHLRTRAEKSVARSPKKSFSRQESVAVPDPEEEEVYAGLDASLSLIIHGKHLSRIGKRLFDSPVWVVKAVERTKLLISLEV